MKRFPPRLSSSAFLTRLLKQRQYPETHYAAAVSLLLSSSTPSFPQDSVVRPLFAQKTLPWPQLECIYAHMQAKQLHKPYLVNAYLWHVVRHSEGIERAVEVMDALLERPTGDAMDLTTFCIVLHALLPRKPSLALYYHHLLLHTPPSTGFASLLQSTTTSFQFYVLILTYIHLNDAEKVLLLFRRMTGLGIDKRKHAVMRTLMEFFHKRGDVDITVDLWVKALISAEKEGKPPPVKQLFRTHRQALECAQEFAEYGHAEEAFQVLQHISAGEEDVWRHVILQVLKHGHVDLAKRMVQWKWTQSQNQSTREQPVTHVHV